MRRRFILGLAASLIVAWAVPAPAATRHCNLTRVASVDLLITPGARGIFMPVRLNDQHKLLLVDTGGVMSTLTPDTAYELSLPIRPSKVRLVNLAGQIMNSVALVERFRIAGVESAPMEFMLHPADDRTGRFAGDQAGTIAPNILSQFDVEIDFAGGKLNLFRHSSCRNSAYWSDGDVASVKIEVTREGHIVLPVELDGHRLIAGLDTGMSYTSLDLNIARQEFKVDTNANDVERLGSLTGTFDGLVYRRQFKTLTTGNGQITVSNPSLILIPDVTNVKRARRGHRRPDVILGLSVLKHLRLYIAYNDKTIFFTPAGGPPAALPLPAEAILNSLRSPEPDSPAAD